MKLGIITGYDAQSFARVKDLKLDHIEVCTNYDEDSARFIQDGDAIRARIDETGIPILSVGRWNAKVIENGKIVRETVDLLKREIETTAKVGCPVFNLGVNRDESISLLKNYNLAVGYLSEMLDFAGERGVKLALYNCSWGNFLYSTPSWNIVLTELPELGIKFDCSHAFARGDDYLKELSVWIKRVYHFHIKGQMRVSDACHDDPPAGIDEIPWPKVFSILYWGGYDGALSIEPHSAIWRGELGERGVRFTIDYIRPFVLR